MRPFPKGDHRAKICLSLVETTTAKMIRAMAAAGPGVDLVEIRADYMVRAELESILRAGEKPIIITNRPKEEGGRFAGTEEARFAVLRQAVDFGAAFVDIEAGSKKSYRRELMTAKKNTRTLLSIHDFTGTPSGKDLRELCRRMTGQGADVVKIVTRARSWDDNLRILSLIPYARKTNQEIVAFCLGEKGKMSRIFAPLLGAAWTYASLDRKKTSAPGQMTASELREVWKRLR